MSVGTNIRKRRFELGMTQQELAEAMGYKTRSTIAKIESGENDVTQKKIQKFAMVLDTTVEDLLLGYEISSSRVTGEYNGENFVRNRNIVLILAGGKSARNQQNIPNQFINISGKPIIAYSMEAYEEHPAIDEIYVVCLKGWESIVVAYAEQYNISKLKGIIPAGSSGILSLKNGLEYIIKEKSSADDILFIQEATRPMVNTNIISKLLQACNEAGSATICKPMKDNIQFMINCGKPVYVDRSTIVDLQSPEAYRVSTLESVFETAERQNHSLTESCCTMLMYNLGFPINFVEGGENNIKIVRQEDIAMLSALLNKS